VGYGSTSPSRSPSVSHKDTDRCLADHYTIYSNLFVSLFEELLQSWRLLRMCKPWGSQLAHRPFVGERSQLLESSPYPRSSPYSPR
jgi:hypothetical protein